MKLISVFSIPKSKNVTKSLPIQNILNKQHKTKYDILLNFRKYVKKGRYGLLVTESVNMGKDGKPAFLYDTQLLEKENN